MCGAASTNATCRATCVKQVIAHLGSGSTKDEINTFGIEHFPCRLHDYDPMSPTQERPSSGHDGGPARPSKRANRALGKQDAQPAAHAPRVHKCTTCGKAFPCPSKDTEHFRVHTGERPFSCHACGDAFATSGTLARHLRTRMGDKPHRFDTDKAFAESSNHARHVRTHTTDDP